MEHTHNTLDDVTCFAQTNFRNVQKRFGIKHDDRRRHMYLIGKTGMGKSTLMENMIITDIEAGNGVCLVDPHGDFAEKLLSHIPKHRTNDVVYFNPADMEHPFAFNVIEVLDPTKKHLVASGLIGIFKKLWADSWGPRLEYVLRNAILALMDTPDTTLLGTLRILTDKEYRKKIISNINDPVVRAFWLEEYSKYPDRFQTEAIAPIQNKVGQFLSTGLIRNIVGQVTSTVDLRDIMDNKKILIMNLSKGRIGEDASALLGAMMITKIQITAMERIDTPESDRQDFYLYVDEFQNFATESFANILSEARKYRLNLIMAHQYIEQLTDEVRGAVFGNVGTIISFRIGATDAEELAKEYAPYVTEEDLVNLSKYEFYLKLMIDGVASKPFSAMTLPPVPPSIDASPEKIIRVARERFATDRSVIEDKIARWSGFSVTPAEKGEKSTKLKSASQPRDGIRITSDTKRKYIEKKTDLKTAEPTETEVECDNCGAHTTINFTPDGIRPVYCRDCLHIPKEQRTGEATAHKNGNNIPEITLADAMRQEPVSFSRKSVIPSKHSPDVNNAHTKDNKARSMSAGDTVRLS